MPFRVHAERKGHTRSITTSSARHAAKHAADRAAVGYRATVYANGYSVMICEPGKKHRRGRHAEAGFSTARCRITDQAFKQRVKRGG